MQENRTVIASHQMTHPPTVGGIDVSKNLTLWQVEVSVLSTRVDHGPARPWRGYAINAEEAKRQAIKARRAEWPGFGVCVRSCREVL